MLTFIVNVISLQRLNWSGSRTNILINYEDTWDFDQKSHFEIYWCKTFLLTSIGILGAAHVCIFEEPNSMLPRHPCAFLFIIDRSKLRLVV